MSKSTEAERKQWRAHIDKQSISGVSARRYCQANKLSESAFSYWKRKLLSSKRDVDIGFIEVPSVSAPQRWEYRTEVNLPGGIRLVIESGSL